MRGSNLGNWIGGTIIVTLVCALQGAQAQIDADAIGNIAGVQQTVNAQGIVRVASPRNDIVVTVDGHRLHPFAGLGSWASFAATANGAIIMGDTVVFPDEVDAAMDAAFEHGVAVTALHNHFFFDDPKVYFMHIGGEGDPLDLARGVRAMWDAVRQVRAEHPTPRTQFPGGAAGASAIDASIVEEVFGVTPATRDGVAKVSFGRSATMNGVEVGGSMGLSTWAAFSGTDELAVVDGDFIMKADEVQPVLRALRADGVHIVSLHNHMLGEEPAYYFAHFWGKGPVRALAQALKRALTLVDSD